MGLEGKTVVVTGGAGVLGTAVVGRLLEAGAICHIPCLSREEADGFVHAKHPNVRLKAPVDLTSETDVAAFYEPVPELWASAQLAGGFAMRDLQELSAAEFLDQMRLNALTCVLCCREAVKAMRRRGGAPGGRLVNVAARPALEPRSGAGMAAYTASKAAVAALTQALGQELAAEEIWVNAVAPSIIDTPSNRAAMPKAHFENWPKPQEIAETIVFLLSPENAVTRGAVVPVYGRF